MQFKKNPKSKIQNPKSPKLRINPGFLFIISAPSGAGKTTLCRAVLDRFQNILYSVSHTTREARMGEQDGVDYFFITPDEFIKGIKNDNWAEWAEVHGNYYGTSAQFIDQALGSGKDILLDIDVQGTMQILKRYPQSITIFIMPPSMDTLKNRIESRGTDSREVIARRLANAEKEIKKKELYHYVIVNDELQSAVSEIVSIIKKYSLD